MKAAVVLLLLNAVVGINLVRTDKWRQYTCDDVVNHPGEPCTKEGNRANHAIEANHDARETIATRERYDKA